MRLLRNMMDERQRKELAKICGGGIRLDCPMAPFTTFRAGGRIAALCFVEKRTTLREIMACLVDEGIPYLVIGKGSNLLVRDGGFPGAGLILKGDLATVERRQRETQGIFAGGGLSLVDLVNYCQHDGMGGLEFLAGIPGTVGGAVAMNAGAWGKEIADEVRCVEVMTHRAESVTRVRSELSFSYRRLALEAGTVVVGVEFAVKSEAPETIADRVVSYLKERKARQPLEYPSAGSIFKNPPNDHAGRLIEMVGLKGRRAGGAMISEKHANFIVNTGGAKAEDILGLMELARRKVMEKTGIALESEIRVVGE